MPFKGGGSVVVDLWFIVTPIVGVCNCSIFCCTLFYVHSSFAIILMGKRKLVALSKKERNKGALFNVAYLKQSSVELLLRLNNNF